MRNEIWKAIPHYEGLYEVSDMGRVRSVETGHIKAQNNNGRGYQFVQLWKNNKGKREYVHRLVALAFIPNPENKPQVDHLDTDRANNVVENLRWVTQSENNLNPITNEKMRGKREGNYATGARNGANTHPEKNNFINNNPSKKKVVK